MGYALPYRLYRDVNIWYTTRPHIEDVVCMSQCDLYATTLGKLIQLEH